MGDGIPTDQLSHNHCDCADSHCNSHIVTPCVFVLPFVPSPITSPSAADSFYFLSSSGRASLVSSVKTHLTNLPSQRRQLRTGKSDLPSLITSPGACASGRRGPSTMAGREQEGRPRTARCLRSDHSHSSREVRPCWRGRRPDFCVCDAARLQPSGRAAWHDTQIQHQVDPPFPPLRRLQVSRRIRRDQEDDGPQTGRHARGQAPIALDVLRDGVQGAPILHHEHGRDGSEALGPWAP